MWRSDEDVRCSVPSSPFYYFETGSLPEPGAHRCSEIVLPESLRDRTVCVLGAGVRDVSQCHSHILLSVNTMDPTSGPMLWGKQFPD